MAGQVFAIESMSTEGQMEGQALAAEVREILMIIVRQIEVPIKKNYINKFLARLLCS